jgi:hypothetical protein
MAAIKNVKYLNEESIYQYFHNPNENFLESFIVDKNPIFRLQNCESGVYIKIFKVPVNSRVNEIFMQEFRWKAWKNGYNTPLPSNYSTVSKKSVTALTLLGFGVYPIISSACVPS